MGISPEEVGIRGQRSKLADHVVFVSPCPRARGVGPARWDNFDQKLGDIRLIDHCPTQAPGGRKKKAVSDGK